jgi:hypothetical protein
VQAMMEGNLNAYNCASETLARPVALARTLAGFQWQMHVHSMYRLSYMEDVFVLTS